MTVSGAFAPAIYNNPLFGWKDSNLRSRIQKPLPYLLGYTQSIYPLNYTKIYDVVLSGLTHIN